MKFWQASLTRGHFKAGLDTVRGAKLRSFWTMLGVIIGVASVITIIGIGQGVRQQISGQIHHLSKDLITIQPAALHPGSGGGNKDVSLLSADGIRGSLSSQDVATIARTKGVGASAPLAVVTGTVRGETGNYNQGFVLGTSGDLSSLLNQSLAYGSFLDPDDQDSTSAVLGPGAAEAMFNEDVPLGRSFSFHGQTFIVRGIFNNFNSAPLNQVTDFNKAIFIPYQIAQQLTNNAAPTYEVLAKPQSGDQTGQVASAIQRALDRAHGGQSNLTVSQGSQNLTTNNDIVSLLTKLIAGVAAISLLVGGLGIMNVMWVSVAERTREIGIRKAVGASNQQILSQFMVEATILSLGGGIIGIIVALLIDVAVRLFTDLQPVIHWQTVALAAGVSFLVGVLFGSMPALKAARRDPIDALRAE
ncbi:MAG TPA: ABC transporter permease [Candidatus Saccharimonadales bacterium]|nr:ABC transporter permease [Candidatus Saccharimonadales bacterium]